MLSHTAPPLLRLRPAPNPPQPPPPPERVVSAETNVLSRLHALFTPHSPLDHGPNDDTNGLCRSKTSPATAVSPMVSPGTVVDRDAIKILVVTWNMGDALPKGDLSVLLGEVPKYTAPPSSSPSIPQLPVENKHPYHIVVVAGQECPTDSGVPRGLGGGIMKGVHVRTAHRREKEERKKEKEKEKEEESGSTAHDIPQEEGLKSSAPETDEDGEEDSRGNSPANTPSTPVLHKHHHPTGAKGWSTMLDDWFCGPTTLADKSLVPSIYPSPSNSPMMSDISPSPGPLPTKLLSAPVQPGFLRSTSAPVGISPTDPVHIPGRDNVVQGFAHSPLARSLSSSSSSSSSSSQDGSSAPVRSGIPIPPDIPAPKSASLPIKKDRPAIVIPVDETEPTKNGGKCYMHLAKERLMGMYLSVYVYKGCEHLVQGVDKDFVTAGLAGGRLGNKGGIGISLKLAGHRFLFVNSHLAAHSTRVSARLANIAKIKSELRLDTFLPKDDSRNGLSDLTDRFDSVFWCGDLNFRLDLSRLHAEWLVEQKKYSEALMWDQLRAAMKDPERNPFPGFQEHTIDFPPTFKYDVWRSIKATNRELKRSLRRRATLEGKHARRPSLAGGAAAMGINPALSHVPEAEAQEETGEETLVGTAKDEAEQNIEDDVRTLASRRSFESTAGGYTSAGPSTAGTDVEDEDFSTSVDASAYGSRHRAIEAAIKAKTKTWLSLVKMDKVLSPASSTRRKLGRSSSKHSKPSEDFDQNARRTSLSSIASLEPPPPITDIPPPRASMSSVRSSEKPLPLDAPRRPSDASFLSISPSQPVRRFSMLKRSVSGRSSTNDGKSGDSHEVYAEDIDESMDIREGVYDTSKKQRVPSWCDRVLWKSQIIPDPEPDLPSSPLEDSHHERGSRTFNRISHAFANFGGHLKLSMTRTTSFETQDRSELHLGKPLPASTNEGTSHVFVASPETSPTNQTESNQQVEVLASTPRRSSSRVSPLPPRFNVQTRSGSSTHPLLDANMVQASPPAHPKITFDPALPADTDRSELVMTRPRANSDSVGTGAGKVKRSSSSLSDNVHITPPRQSGIRRFSGGSLRIKEGKTLQPAVSTPTVSRPDRSQHRLSSTSVQLSHSQSNQHTEERNSFVKFLKDIPTLLHVRPPTTQHESVTSPSAMRDGWENVKPRRHLKGEVECLHYGTIDDAAMRQLEGRSDHRPAIFSAAVYVGD